MDKSRTSEDSGGGHFWNPIQKIFDHGIHGKTRKLRQKLLLLQTHGNEKSLFPTVLHIADSGYP